MARGKCAVGGRAFSPPEHVELQRHRLNRSTNGSGGGMGGEGLAHRARTERCGGALGAPRRLPEDKPHG